MSQENKNELVNGLPSGEMEGDLSRVDKLPVSVVNANWKLPSSRLPHWLIYDAGMEIENIASMLVGKVESEMGASTIASIAGEMKNDKSLHRAFRFVHRFQPGHLSATDVILRAEGRDLYVRCLTKPRTLLAYLRYVWMTSLFLIGVFSILFAYFAVTGAKQSWVQDYARRASEVKYPGDDKANFVTRCALDGYYRTDWQLVRKKLRENPEIVKSIKENLLQKIQQVANSSARSSQKGLNIEAFAAVGETFELRALVRLNEYVPDYIAEKQLREMENGDEYGYWRVSDEFRRTTLNLGSAEKLLSDADGISFFMALPLLDTQPLLWSESLESVQLVSYTASFLGDPNLEAILIDSTTWQPPISYLGLVLADPRGALLNLLAPCGLISAMVGFFVLRSPKSWLRYPCGILGWITPDDFESRAIASSGRVARLLSSSLQEIGFGRNSITELGDVESSRG